jgi:hypothetical protein
MTDPNSTLRWPLETDRWIHTVLVGALLVATMPLVLPGVLLGGYAVRLLRADEGTLPTFADLRSLVRTGLWTTGIVTAYLLPVAALVAVGSTTVTSPSVAWRTALLGRPSVLGAVVPSSPSASVVVTVLAGLVLLPVCGYVATVAVTAYASTDDVAEAFAPDRIGRQVRSTATVRAWLLASLVVVGSGVCAALLGVVATAVPGVGSLLVAAVQFYGGVVAIGVWDTTRPIDGVGTETRERAEPAATDTAG